MEATKRKIPIVTIILLGLNVVAFILSTEFFPQLFTLGEVENQKVLDAGEYYRLLTGMFLHVDINHLVGNMLLFVCLGDLLERNIGGIRFLIGYILSGMIGNLFSVLYSTMQGRLVAAVGASGGVFGMVGIVLFLVLINRGRLESITIKRLILMIVLSLYAGFTGTNIDNVSHVTGFMAGFLIAIVLIAPGYGRKKDS